MNLKIICYVSFGKLEPENDGWRRFEERDDLIKNWKLIAAEGPCRLGSWKEWLQWNSLGQEVANNDFSKNLRLWYSSAAHKKKILFAWIRKHQIMILKGSLKLQNESEACPHNRMSFNFFWKPRKNPLVL